MKPQYATKQPGVITRFDRLLASEPETLATIRASMPPGLSSKVDNMAIMQTHLAGLVCAVGWWWVASREGDLPIDIPPDFLSFSSRSELARKALEQLGAIGERLLPMVLPLEGISSAAIGAQSAFFHWSDLVRSSSPDFEQALHYFWEWLFNIGASQHRAA